MSTNHVLIVILAIVCGVLCLVLISQNISPKSASDDEAVRPEAPATPTVQPEGEPAAPVRESISEAVIDALYLGYTYEQIEDKFGIPADERESEYCRDKSGITAPYSIVWYTWYNPDNTQIRLGFINNKLERKQFIQKDGSVVSNEINLDDL